MRSVGTGRIPIDRPPRPAANVEPGPQFLRIIAAELSVHRRLTHSLLIIRQRLADTPRCMSTAPGPNNYLKTKILTASPGELRMMLLDGAVRFARKGGEGLAAKNYETAYEGVSRAQAIVMELISALKPEHDPELCKRLSGLYTFIYNQLVRGLMDRDPALLDEAVRLLEYEAETWRMTLDRLDDESQAAGGSVPHDQQSFEAPAGRLVSLTG